MLAVEEKNPLEGPSLSTRKKKIFSLVTISFFILFCAAIFWFVGRPMVRFISEPSIFRAWVDSHGFWGRLAFAGMMVVQIVIAIIPGEPLEIAAGYTFGIVEGTLLCLAGSVLGSLIVFLFVRRFGIRAVEVFFPREKLLSLKFIQNSRRLNLLVFILFFIPGTPMDIMTYFVPFTPMKLSTWLLISATARIPSIITSAIGGDALGLQNYLFAIIAFAATLTLSLGGVLLYRHISRKRK